MKLIDHLVTPKYFKRSFDFGENFESNFLW